MKLTVATFNVNSITARSTLVLKWLLEKNPVDILCLQELKCEENAFPFGPFHEAGYECVVFGQKGYNGVAICSKFSMKEIQKGFGNERLDRQKRLIRASIASIDVINIYAPHGGGFEDPKHAYKLEFYEYLTDYIKKNVDLGRQVICVGDMNVARSNLDVYDPAAFKDTIGFMEDEQEAFEKFLQSGLVDLYRMMHPNESGFTWWDYRGGGIWKNEGMRIDYILASPVLAQKCQEIFVDLWPRKRRSPTPSDHAPIVAAFEIGD